MKLTIGCIHCYMEREIDLRDLPKDLRCPECGRIGLACLQMQKPVAKFEIMRSDE